MMNDTSHPSRRTESHRSSKESELMRMLTDIFDQLVGEGKLLQADCLLRNLDYPDFWVRDPHEREFLIEAKNWKPGKLKPGTARNPMGSNPDTWVEEYKNTKKLILDKAWQDPLYYLKGRKSIRQVNNPLPVLVISHMQFDLQSLKALSNLFGKRGDRIVNFEHQLPSVEGAALLRKRLRDLFAREKIE